ncbi:hypothetical protein ACMD2_25592, partial [Ananas comosus]
TSFISGRPSRPRHPDPARDRKRGNMATTVKNSSSLLGDEALRLIHQNWMRRYEFEYEDEEEEEKRFKIFKATFEEIEKYNTEEEAPLLILSRYSDLTDAEFFALRSTIQGELPKDMRDDVTLRRHRRSGELPEDMQDDVSLRPHRQEDCDACVLHKRGRKS